MSDKGFAEDVEKYTTRFAHLAETTLKVGDTVRRGDKIGTMGNTGVGTGAHLHIDTVIGEVSKRYNLNDMGNRTPEPCKRELDYFIDDELFGVRPEITTQYNDPEYKAERGKPHPAYDLVPYDRPRWENGKSVGTTEHFTIRWNRSYEGRVIRADYNDVGYGTVVYIVYEKRRK